MAKITILPCVQGARQAKGVTIIVDVFRAGNTAAALFSAGTPYIVPVASLEDARSLKEAHPGWLLVGERGGIRPEGFDLNNSPAQASKMALDDRPAIFTTSAGTRGLAAAFESADVLLMATLVNAGAVSERIRHMNPEQVTIVPIGLEGNEPAEEDDAVARYLAERIEGRTPDYRSTVKTILSGGGAKRLRRLKQWRDLAWCLRLDQLDVVPVASSNAPESGMVLTPMRPSGSMME